MTMRIFQGRDFARDPYMVRFYLPEPKDVELREPDKFKLVRHTGGKKPPTKHKAKRRRSYEVDV